MFRSYLDKEQGLAWWVVLPHLHVNIATPLGWSGLDCDGLRWEPISIAMRCVGLISRGDERVR